MTTFRESHVEADGFRLRYAEAGGGPPLLHLHGAGGMRLNRAHEQLAGHFRVIALELPGFGEVENTASQTMADYAATVTHAADALGLDRFNLWGTSFGGATACWLAVQAPERLLGLVLEAPAAIRPPGVAPPTGSPQEVAKRLFAHPERMPPLVLPPPEIQAQRVRMMGRLRRPDRDPDLEARLRQLAVPTLVLFGTLDHVIPSEMGRHYKELLPDCHFVLVYDAGHAIGAERPEAFTEIVIDFLDRHDAFVISRQETLIHP